MSFIHNALKHANTQPSDERNLRYNPLAKQQKKTHKNTLYIIIGCFFILGSVALFMLPKQVTNTDLNVVASPNTQQDSEPVVISPVKPAIAPQTQELQVDVELEENIKATGTDNQPQPLEFTQVTAQPPSPVTKNESKPMTKAADKKVTVIAEPKQIKTDETVRNSTTASSIQPTQIPVSGNSNATNSVIKSSQAQWQATIEQHIKAGQIEQAEAVLKQWIGASPSDSTPKILLAKIYISNKFYQSAEPLLEQQTSAEAQALLGVVYERTKRPQLAAQIFESLYRKDPNNGKWLLFWAINAENSQQKGISTAIYKRYVEVFAETDQKLTDFARQRLAILEGG